MTDVARLCLACLAIVCMTSCGSNKEPMVDLRAPPGIDLNASGLYLYQQGDLASAEVFFRDAIRAAESEDNRETVADGRFNLGLVLRDSRRPEEALGELDRAEALYIRLDAPVAATRAAVARATVLETTEGPAAALAVLERALETCPPEARALVQVETAAAHLSLGDPGQARLGAEAALAEVGSDDHLRGDGLFVLGRALLELGELDAARPALSEALALDKQLGRKRAIAKTLGLLAELEEKAGNAESSRDLRHRADAVESALEQSP